MSIEHRKPDAPRTNSDAITMLRMLNTAEESRDPGSPESYLGPSHIKQEEQTRYSSLRSFCVYGSKGSRFSQTPGNPATQDQSKPSGDLT
jgi:hypothetical protein